MTHLMLALVLATEPAQIRPRPVAGKLSYRVNLRPGRRDYQLISPPGPGAYAVVLQGGNPSGKCKLLFATPLRPGRYFLQVRPTFHDAGQTFVFSVPLAAGESSFIVSASGKARYDFAFQHQAGVRKEHRFSFTAPVIERTFDLAP
jgi:hypothetical protein